MARIVIISLIATFILADNSSLCAEIHRQTSPAVAQPVNTVEKERRTARIRRLFYRMIDDLKTAKRIAEEDIAELEKQIDDITPTEPMQREADILSMLDTHYSYLDWVKDRSEDLEDDLEQLSADAAPGGDYLGNTCLEMASMLEELAKVVKEKVERFDAEEKRLADILERRRLLQSRLDDLNSRRDTVRRKPVEKWDSPGEKDAAEKRIGVDIDVVQNELLSLPQIDEDILKHYLLLSEWGRSEEEWLSLQEREYRMLAEVAALLPRDTVRSAGELERAFQRTIRGYENEITQIERMIDRVERQRSRITPAGTLRETDRSQELADLYDRMEQRYGELIERLRVAIGAWQTEISEVRSAGK